jgi:hypothetical protein
MDKNIILLLTDCFALRRLAQSFRRVSFRTFFHPPMTQSVDESQDFRYGFIYFWRDFFFQIEARKDLQKFFILANGNAVALRQLKDFFSKIALAPRPRASVQRLVSACNLERPLVVVVLDSYRHVEKL